MQKKPPKHSTMDDRIEALLGEYFSLRYIADRLDKSPSTISREIKKHTITHSPNCCDCIYFPDCSRRLVYGSSSCPKKCTTCAKTKKHCPDYVQAFCDTPLEHPLHLCNPCHKSSSAISKSEFIAAKFFRHISHWDNFISVPFNSSDINIKFFFDYFIHSMPPNICLLSTIR